MNTRDLSHPPAGNSKSPTCRHAADIRKAAKAAGKGLETHLEAVNAGMVRPKRPDRDIHTFVGWFKAWTAAPDIHIRAALKGVRA